MRSHGVANDETLKLHAYVVCTCRCPIVVARDARASLSRQLFEMSKKQDNVYMNTEYVQCILIVYSICPYKYDQ